MSLVRALVGTPAALRRLALASVVANVGIVITGGAVRLTGSGLGCPTWPRCTAGSYVATPEMGINGAIEFGNRLLTFVLVMIALSTVVSALSQQQRRRRVTVLAVAGFAVIPAQGVVGGLTVLTDLNPYVVGGHFLVSIGILVVTYALWREVSAGSGPPARPGPSSVRALGAVTVAASAAVLVVGVIVTGSGPHAGDADARRTGLDPATISQLHADLVFLLVGLTVGLVFAVRAAGAPAAAQRAALLLLVVELAQGLIGFVQYLTDLPVLLVGAHMGGACAVWLATIAAYAHTTRTGPPLPAPPHPTAPHPTAPHPADAPHRPEPSLT